MLCHFTFFITTPAKIAEASVINKNNNKTATTNQQQKNNNNTNKCNFTNALKSNNFKIIYFACESIFINACTTLCGFESFFNLKTAFKTACAKIVTSTTKSNNICKMFSVCCKTLIAVLITLKSLFEFILLLFKKRKTYPKWPLTLQNKFGEIDDKDVLSLAFVNDHNITRSVLEPTLSDF